MARGNDYLFLAADLLAKAEGEIDPDRRRDRLTADARARATRVTAARFADSRATTHRKRRRPGAPRPIYHRALRCRACAR
jgi:hypothetical protein